MGDSGEGFGFGAADGDDAPAVEVSLDAFMTAATPDNFDPDANVWIAASDGDVKRVKELLESKAATANSKDERGYTPMHAAASYGHEKLLEMLIESGGDANVQDEDGDSPLHACETAPVAALLIKAKADLMHKNNEGLTALAKLLATEAEGEPFDEALKDLLLVETLRLRFPTRMGGGAAAAAPGSDEQKTSKKKKKKNKKKKQPAPQSAEADKADSKADHAADGTAAAPERATSNAPSASPAASAPAATATVAAAKPPAASSSAPGASSS